MQTNIQDGLNSLIWVAQQNYFLKLYGKLFRKGCFLSLQCYSISSYFPCSETTKDKQTIPLIACNCYRTSGEGMTGMSPSPLEPGIYSFYWAYSADWGRPMEALRPHWEITQRWDLMALRLRGSERPTSNPPALTPGNPSHPPGSSACHWSFVKLLTLIWLPSNLGSADYTLLGSRQAAFSNFTRQQIAGLFVGRVKGRLFVLF